MNKFTLHGRENHINLGNVFQTDAMVIKVFRQVPNWVKVYTVRMLEISHPSPTLFSVTYSPIHANIVGRASDLGL